MAIVVTTIPVHPASRLAAPSSCSMNASALRKASEETAGSCTAFNSSVTLCGSPRHSRTRSLDESSEIQETESLHFARRAKARAAHPGYNEDIAALSKINSFSRLARQNT